MKSKEDLIKEISQFLDDSPFDDVEVKQWKSKMSQMTDQELNELFELLNKKLEIITETNQLFLDMADQVVINQQKDDKELSKNINILNLNIEDLVNLFRTKLAQLLNSEINLIKELDDYFSDYSDKINIISHFELLANTITNNMELLFGQNKPSVRKVINLYNQFSEGKEGSNLDRISFVNQNEEIKILGSDEKKIILKLLQLYDYLYNPEAFELLLNDNSENVNINKSKTNKKVGLPDRVEISQPVSSPDLQNLKQMLNQYPVGSIERRAVEEEMKKLSEL